MLFRAVGTAVMLVLAWGAWGASAAAEPGPRAAVCAGAGAAFGVESTVLLNEAERHAGEVGYRLRARLSLRPVWSHGDEHLLRLQLEGPQLLLQGKRANAPFVPHKSVWDSFPSTEFYAHLNKGAVEVAYLDPSEPLDILNYKRSLISLFQVQVTEEEHNETDISGTCEVSYEAVSENVVRKIKRRCSWGGEAPDDEQLRARRLLRLELAECGAAAGGEGGLRAAHAEELVELRGAGGGGGGGAGGGGGGGLKARAWTQLTRAAGGAGPAGGGGARPDSLRAALAALPPELAPHALPLHAAPDEPDQVGAEEVRLALRRWAEAVAGRGEAAGGGGGAEQALAALQLLRVVRAAPAAALQPLLEQGGAPPALCRLLGAAGASGAHLAAGAGGGAEDGPPAPCAAAYLSGLALAPAPPAHVARDALALAGEARSAALRELALLAGAAAASEGPPDLRLHARELLLDGLAKCKEEACRELRLHALGNLRDPAAAEPALRRAEGGSRREALAALGALGRLQAAGDAPPELRARLARLALGAARPLEVRAAALELLAARCRRPEHAAPLARLALQLDERGPPELRRLLRMRLRALTDGDGDGGAAAGCGRAMRALLPALGGGGARGWAGRAAEHAATSSVLARRPGWGGAAAGGWRARLDSVQVAAGAVLRRGVVALLAEPPAELDEPETSAEPSPLLAVELWTQGLEELTGSGAGAAAGEDADMCVDGAGGEAEPGAELALSVGGVRLRGAALFAGRAELLAQVWAGAGSEPTPVLRALRPARPRRHRHPLLAGVELRGELHAAALYALDAQAQVSLWSRTARSLLELRAAAARRAELAVRPAWGELRAASTQLAAAALDVAADLDFYDGVALCVRVAAGGQRLCSNATLQARAGAAPGLRVRRGRAAQLQAAGRTLALGAPNDAACRTLAAG